jgi:hypothetical protein
MANVEAYGFHTVRSLWDQRVTEVGIERVNELVQLSSGEHSRQLDALLSNVATADPTLNTSPIRRYTLPSSGELQPVDELGVADPRRSEGYYQQAWPLMRGEDAYARSYEAAQKLTVGELNNELLRVQRADANWNITRMLFALMHETTWTQEDKEFGTLTVKPLANGDTDTYEVTGQSALQTDDHYLAQANAISDSDDPFPTIYDELDEHTVNSGPYVCFVPSGLRTAIQGLAEFTPRYQTTTVEFGDNEDLAGLGIDGFQLFGDRVLGEHNEGVIIVQWRRLPANYMVALNLGSPVMRYRQESVASLQGLFQIEATTNSGNVLLNRFRRIRGYAPANRVGAVVMRIGNASYASPSPYDAIPS